MKMTLQKIERLINTALRSLRNCIWDHPECYWPQEGYQNSLPERNLTIHLAHTLLANGWVVFSEASFPNRTNRRIDLLGLKRGILIGAECKQLDMTDRAKEFSHDIGDIKRFTLTSAWDTDEWRAPPVTARYGVLMATTWSIDVKDWWTGLEISRCPVNHSGDGWASLGRRLQPFRNGRSRGIFGDLWLTRSDTGKPDFWALYAVLKLKKQS